MAPRRKGRKTRSLSFYYRTEDDLATLLDKEVDFMPSQDYVDKLCSGTFSHQARETIVRFTLQTLHNQPDACILCISFYDRYCSKQKLSVLETQHITFIALACMILALKVEDSDDINTHTFLRLLLDMMFQCSWEQMIAWEQMIYKTEATILKTLDWRMIGITTPRFIALYLKMIEQEFSASLPFLEYVTDILVELLEDVRFAFYRPSRVAAAVLLKVMDEQDPIGSEQATRHKITLLVSLPSEVREGVSFCFREIHGANLRVKLHHSQQPDEQRKILDNLTEDLSISSYDPQLDVNNERSERSVSQSTSCQMLDNLAGTDDLSLDMICSNPILAGRHERSNACPSPSSTTLWCDENLEQILIDIPECRWTLLP